MQRVLQSPPIAEKVVQFKAVGLLNHSEVNLRLPETSTVRASSSKDFSILPPALNKDESSSKDTKSVQSVRKLDYRRYLNELDNVRENSYGLPAPSIDRSEYLLPQTVPAAVYPYPASPRSTIGTIGAGQSPRSNIERLKEDNRNILRRLHTMGI